MVVVVAEVEAAETGTLEAAEGCGGTEAATAPVAVEATEAVEVATDGADDEAIKEEVEDNEVGTAALDVLNGSTVPKGEIPGKPGGLPKPANKEFGPPIFG